MIIVTIALILMVFIILLFCLATYFNYRTSHHPNQAKFDKGNISDTGPDGFYKGNNFSGLGKKWMGKTFDAANHSGINTFPDGNRYTFNVYKAQGLRDNKTVLRLDYNLKGNPFWMRSIKDEIVEVAPGHYLGKVNFKIIPGLPVTATYFELSKAN